MPIPINRTDTTRRNHFSKDFILLYTFPMEPIEKAINHAKMITGKLVAKAKTRGRKYPAVDETDKGINPPK